MALIMDGAISGGDMSGTHKKYNPKTHIGRTGGKTLGDDLLHHEELKKEDSVNLPSPHARQTENSGG